MSESLNSDREYKNSLESNYYKHIGHEHVENLFEEIEADRDDWESIQIPDSLNQWFSDFQKLEEKRIKKKRKGKTFLRILKKVAVVLVFFVGFNYILLANVDAYRFGILNSIINIQNKFTKIDIDKEDTTMKANIPKDWAGWYYMTYWPKGYYLTSSKSEGAWATIVFTDAKGNYITLQQSMLVSSQYLDSEEGNITRFEINGEEALYAEKDNIRLLSWIQDDRAFYLEANEVNTKELIKIAENIKKKLE